MPRGDKPTTAALALKDGWIYEDALPVHISKEQYDWWLKESLVLGGVRMGPPLPDNPEQTTPEPCAVQCGTRRSGTMIVITGCGQTPCRCHVEQVCADCGATFFGLEMLGDPQCDACFEKQLFSEPFPDVQSDGVDGLESWLS